MFSCFTIACKLESRRVPDANSLIALFDSRYHVTPNHLNHGEKQLLTQLDFELGLFLKFSFFSYSSFWMFRISISNSFSLLLSSIFTISFCHLFIIKIYD